MKDICQLTCIHEEKVARAQASMPDERSLEELAAVFGLLSEPTRVRILYALGEEELCVCDIAAVVDASPSAISHQLRLLRTARLVRARKAGKMVYYSLDDTHVRNLFEEGMRHIREK